MPSPRNVIGTQLLNLDTHILLHALAGSLKRRERTLLSKQTWSISAIVLSEIAKLVQLGRVSLDLDATETVRVLKSIHTWPVDLEIARASTRLDFKGDPADELIAATSVVHNVPLLTRDRRILSSRRVPLA
jgi:PIN domain nuclease of toxin-antitoxin system